MIEAKNIFFKYDGDWILKEVDFSISEGEKIALFGVNGSGKTSLLKLLNGLNFPQKGKILFNGQELTKHNLKDKVFRKAFRTSVGLLFQNPDVMLFNATVYDELSYGLKQLQCKKTDEKINYWADRLRITGLLNNSPAKLSGGEKQRVALASTLILEPELFLLDEPFSSLDPEATGWLIDFLQYLDTTLVIALHNIELAREIATRIIVLSKDHKIIYDGDINKFVNDKEKLIRAGLWHSHLGKEPHIHNF